jgi:hypothetical protein
MGINEVGSKNRFNKLLALYKEESINFFGSNLIWNELPNTKYSTISLRKDANVKDKSQWKDQHAWLIETVGKFDKFFRPKIRSINI